MVNDDSDDKTATRTKPRSRGSDFRSLRILVIEPRGRYCKSVWCAIGIGLAHVFIGATVMTALLFHLNVGDLHAVLCTVAYHFFTAEAILSLNYANGWSAPLHLRHRRYAHIFLQFCGIVCGITGTLLVCKSKGLSGTVHGVTGMATATLAVISLLTGPCGLLRGRYFKFVHTCFGIPTFLLSSISLCSGLSTSDFEKWANTTVIFILIGFIVFYTVFILVTCFIKCMMRIY
ncbi:uncharacterized protein LOC120631754 [Pararge aegeria]|uniref:uncharacterized protein LOC120631754 n=1 Tax=Pararge aegeria TaxID=116150 RepID=UPI0019D2D384|nr:uncharacterized protein LOC120631754 [Pararge aegeria]